MAEALGSFITSFTGLLWGATRTNIDITISNKHPKMKLAYATRFTLGGGCVDPPANEIENEESTTIHLKADTTKTQFEGVLLYKLISTESGITMATSIYLALGWKVTASDGLHAHMMLIEHDGDFAFLERDRVKEHYYQIFCDKPRKLYESIRCSWSLGGSVPFTISMTANDDRFGKANVEIKAGKSEEDYAKPMTLDLVEWVYGKDDLCTGHKC
jgi:hypothetical protein